MNWLHSIVLSIVEIEMILWSAVDRDGVVVAIETVADDGVCSNHRVLATIDDKLNLTISDLKPSVASIEDDFEFWADDAEEVVAAVDDDFGLLVVDGVSAVGAVEDAHLATS